MNHHHKHLVSLAWESHCPMGVGLEAILALAMWGHEAILFYYIFSKQQ